MWINTIENSRNAAFNLTIRHMISHGFGAKRGFLIRPAIHYASITQGKIGVSHLGGSVNLEVLVQIIHLHIAAKGTMGQGRFHKGVQLAVEHIFRCCIFMAGTQIFHQLIGL